MARRPKTKSMAEIVVDVQEQKALESTSATPVDDLASHWIEVDGRRFTVSDDELRPKEARDLAEVSQLVVWDSCGCGGGCGYEVWQGQEVSALLKAGVPKVKNGSVSRIEDAHGRLGVLCERAVRWGPLR